MGPAALLLLALQARAGVCDDTDVDPWDTGFGSADCDEDGWTRRDGDCDDFDGDIHPEAREECGDREDNDCNGYFDDGCDDGLQRGSLLGGSSCGGGLAALLLLPAPLLAFGRRRR